MRRLLSLLLSAALVLTLASCGSPGGTSGSQTDSGSASSSGTAQEPVDIPFSLAVYPSYSLHPVLAENRANLTLSPLLYEPLFQLDEAFQAAVAQSVITEKVLDFLVASSEIETIVKDV